MKIVLEILGWLTAAGLVGLLFKKGGDLLGKLTDYIASKIKNQQIADMVRRVDEAALKAVKLTYQAYVGPIKKEGASLNDQEKAMAKELAKAEIKDYLGPKGIREALEILGLDKEKLDRFFDGSIESNVYDEKIWNNPKKD